MPMMPTFEVTQEQAERLLTVFGSPQGYLDWLVREVIEEVLDREARQRVEQFRIDEQQRRAAARAEFGLDDPS